MVKKVVLITGGARGIGLEIATLLAKKGYIVIANYNKSVDLALKLKEQAINNNWDLDIFQCDISKRKEIEEMIKFVINKYKRIDVLINNAGISLCKLFQDLTDNDWNTIMNTNLYSAFCTTQNVVPYMIKEKCGCIINISSVWGMVGASCETLYSISKAGMDGMTKSLAKELGPSNIRVNSIAPGIINTDMNKNLSEKTIKSIIEEIPLNKIGSSSSIANCVNWIIEDEYTTGQIISINGGWIIT